MIKIDTSMIEENKSGIPLEIAGDPIHLATEMLSIVSCLKYAILDRHKDNKKLAAVEGLMFDMTFLHGLKYALQQAEEVSKEDSKNDKATKDIRSADFDSDDDFLRFLRGLGNEEE